MLREMFARYPGKCHGCGGSIARGSRMVYDRSAPPLTRALHVGCVGDVSFVPLESDDESAPVDAEAFHHARGRCIDAPCCGCCS